MLKFFEKLFINYLLIRENIKQLITIIFGIKTENILQILQKFQI